MFRREIIRQFRIIKKTRVVIIRVKYEQARQSFTD